MSDTEHARKWARFGRQASQQGDHTSAVFALERAVELGENSTDAWIALGIARAHQRQTESAIQALQHAVQLDPTSVTAWCIIGELGLELKQYSLSLDAFKHCFELDPKGANPHGARAKALVRKTYKSLQSDSPK